MQKIERDTLHRIADEIIARNHDKNATLSKSYGFSAWAAEFSQGDDDLEQRLFDEQDAMTAVMYDQARKYGIEVYEDE